MDFTWLGIQICICWSQIPLKKSRGVDQKAIQYLVWPPFASWSAITSPSHRVEQAVDCGQGKFVPLLLMAVWSCWILAGTVTRCRTHQSRASQTCSIGDMSGEYSGHGRTGTFSASRNCLQILVTCTLSCWNMRWLRMNGMTMGRRISS